MEVKEKRCKGIGKAHGYTGCGKLTLNRKYGLCSSCLSSWIDETDEGKIFLESLKIKGKKLLKKTQKKEEKALKKSLQSKSEYEKILQKLVNKIVRYIDSQKGCISCEHGHFTPFTRKADAGHYRSVGSNATLRFHLDNIHKQCFICNRPLSANLSEYRKGLIKRYGQAYLDHVEQLAKKYPAIHLSIPELEEAIKKTKKILKEIENGSSYSRTLVNNILNIYQ